jgi:hypothetical protein
MKNQFCQRDLPQFETTQQATPLRRKTLLGQSAALALLGHPCYKQKPWLFYHSPIIFFVMQISSTAS